MDYRIADLEYYNRIIEQAVLEFGLDCYPQEFEICDYEEMLSYEAYSGMPSRYPHWSFGKAWERKKTFYRYNLIGLPYEMVINSNPCLAYLMKENTLALQVLTIAHVYGHNDFFKNNRLFKNETRANYTVEMFKSHASRISGYLADPSIGYERVERILDAAHALRFQVYRISNEKHLSPEEIKESHMEKYHKAQLSKNSTVKENQGEQPNWDRIPLEPEEDIILFLLRYARLSEWEKDIISIVRSEAQYFMPQIETKIMNEGWASFWHYKILNHINLPQSLYLEFIKRHNQVIASRPGTINPYHLGFKIFCKLEQEGKQLFDVREQERDVSFIRRYLDEELCQELNLLEFQKEKQEYVIREISDESGWKTIRDTLIMNVGMNGIPVIKVSETDAAKVLHLEHEWDGRELLQDYAHQTIKYIARLWGNKVRLRVRINGEQKILESDGE